VAAGGALLRLSQEGFEIVGVSR